MMTKLLRIAMERHARHVHIAMPARIEKYDATLQKAQVKPIIREAYVTVDDEEYVTHSLAMVVAVPIVWPSGGPWRMTFPVHVGDTGLLVFSEVNVGKWLAFGGDDVDPENILRNHLSDGIFIPGLHPFTKAWKGVRQDAITIGKDEGLQLHITETEILLGGGAATHPVAKGDELNKAIKAALDALTAAATTMGAGAASNPVLSSQAAAFATALKTATEAFGVAAQAALSNAVKVKQ